MSDTSLVFIELGVAIVGLALLARLASRTSLLATPRHLLVSRLAEGGCNHSASARTWPTSV